MKKLILILFLFVSLATFGQGTSKNNGKAGLQSLNENGATTNLNIRDTAAQRKEQEAINKFVSDLVTKTSIADFQKWMYDNNAGVKDFEAFNKMYNAFIQQKYIASKTK